MKPASSIMRTLIVITVVLAALAVLLQARQPVDPTNTPETGLGIGQLAPDFALVTDTGEQIALSDLRGQIVLLNFWATWCGPCRIEMPEFQRVSDQFADQGLLVLAVNNGESQAAVSSFRQALGLTFLLGLDEQAEVQRQYNIFSYPSTLVIDRDGQILARHFGTLTADQIDQLLEDIWQHDRGIEHG